MSGRRLFAAVNPLSGASFALIAPTANTHHINEHLRVISREPGAQVHVVLVLDKAGWHLAKGLKVPENITLLHLPPYSLELNEAERIWGYLRSHYRSHRSDKDYDELFEAIKQAWDSLQATHLVSLTHGPWGERGQIRADVRARDNPLPSRIAPLLRSLPYRSVFAVMLLGM